MKRTSSSLNSGSHIVSRLGVVTVCFFTLLLGLISSSAEAYAKDEYPQNHLSLKASVLSLTYVDGVHPHYSDSKFEISRGSKGGSWFTPGASLGYGRRLAKYFDLGVFVTWDLYKDDPTINNFRLMIAPTLVIPVAKDKFEITLGLPIGGAFGIMKVDAPYEPMYHSLFGFSVMVNTGAKLYFGKWGAMVDFQASLDSATATTGDFGYNVIQLFSANIGIVRRF